MLFKSTMTKLPCVPVCDVPIGARSTLTVNTLSVSFGRTEQGIDDLSAVMEPGIVALLAATARGVVPSAAALTLWHEFVRTRSALLELVAPPVRPCAVLPDLCVG